MGVSSDSSCAARGAAIAKMAMTTSVAAMQQQEGVLLHEDESGMVGFGLPWELELTFHHHCLYWFQVDRVVPTCGDKHCASGHGRRGGKGKFWKSGDSLLFRHFPGYAALGAPQDGCDGSVGL